MTRLCFYLQIKNGGKKHGVDAINVLRRVINDKEDGVAVDQTDPVKSPTVCC